MEYVTIMHGLWCDGMTVGSGLKRVIGAWPFLALVELCNLCPYGIPMS